MKQLEPLYDRIVLRVVDSSERMHGSLYIPDVAKDKPQIGQVLAVGPGELLPGGHQELCLKVGDLVLFNRYAGSEVRVEDAEYLILRETDVLAKVVEVEQTEGVVVKRASTPASLLGMSIDEVDRVYGETPEVE